MPISLIRRPGVAIDPSDAEASRAWIRQHVRQQVVLQGHPEPKIYLLGGGFLETFDLDVMTRRDPDAHAGATLRALRRRDHVDRCFLVVRLSAPAHQWAMIFEERLAPEGRRWWMAMLGYRTDPLSGLGLPDADWQYPAEDTADLAEVPEFAHEIAAPPPGVRAAAIADASDTWQPDIKFAFGDLPEGTPAPVDAREMVELAAALAVPDLLNGKLTGTVVVRITGRGWEQWVLGDDMPCPLVEMVRWIANHRLPAAEGVAVAQLAIRPGDDPPIPGVQVIAEYDSSFVETWAPIEFGETRSIPLIHWWPARPVVDANRWIGVESKANLEEGGPTA